MSKLIRVASLMSILAAAMVSVQAMAHLVVAPQEPVFADDSSGEEDGGDQGDEGGDEESDDGGY